MKIGSAQNTKSKRKLIFLIPIFLVVFIWLGLDSFYRWSLNNYLSKNNKEVTIEIQKGEGVKSIAGKLKEQNLIGSEFLFLTYVKREKLDTQIQAGFHTIKPSSSLKDIGESLKRAETKQEEIKILEGWALFDIKKYLSLKGVDLKEFETCLSSCEFDYSFITPEIKAENYEGFLFPDTYKVDLDLAAEKVLNKIFTNFQNKIASIKQGQIKGGDEFTEFVQAKNLYEKIIVASMVEREVRTDLDRKLVAGIIWKRLQIEMPLGIDATFLYELGDWDAQITYEVLKENTPYNLRTRQGLPPTPICQPSLASIEAAFYPEESEYLYYLTPDSGEVIYAKTLEEHNQNKQKYL